jgi:hypothetical protein
MRPKVRATQPSTIGLDAAQDLEAAKLTKP